MYIVCILIFVLVSPSHQAKKCASGTTEVKKLSLCFQLVGNLSFVKARDKCKSMGGQLFMPASSEEMQLVRDSLFPGNNFLAWIGIVGNTKNGKIVYIDGKDASQKLYLSDFLPFNGSPPKGYSDSVMKCWNNQVEQTGLYSCKDLAVAFKCLGTNIKKYASKPKDDIALYQQYTVADPAISSDKKCIKAMQEQNYKVNIKKPIIALVMDLVWGYAKMYPDTYFYTASKSKPALCSFKKK